MKMANNRLRTEKHQTYGALALMWLLIDTSAMPVASRTAAVMGQMNVALIRRISMVIAMGRISRPKACPMPSMTGDDLFVHGGGGAVVRK